MPVPERLLEIRPALVVAGLAGLLTAAALYRVGVGVQLPDYPLGKADIVARARALAASQGLDTHGAIFVPQPTVEPRAELNAAIGVVEARRASLSDEVPVTAWRVRMRKSYLVDELDDDPGGLDARFTETGAIVAADVREPRAKDPAPPREEAKQIAVERLGALGISLDGYTERTSESDPDPDDVNVKVGSNESVEVVKDDDAKPDEVQTTQKIVWERPAPNQQGVTLVVTATVTASGLTSFIRTINYANDPETPDQVPTFIQNVFAGVFYTLLVPLIMGIGLLRFITKEYVKRRRALLAGLVFFVGAAAAVAVTTSLDESILVVALGATIVPLLVMVPVCCAWLVGEADAYYMWGKHVTEGALAILTFRPFSRQVARETLEGYLWGWSALGAIAVIAALVALIAGPDAVRQAPALEIADANPTWLFWLDEIPYTLAIGSMGYLFMTSWVQRLVKRPWLSLSISSLAVALFVQGFHVISLAFGPLPRIASWAIPLGVGACLLTVRRGLLTATAATFALSTYYFGLAGLVVGTAAEHLAALAGLAIVAIPPLLALAIGHKLPQVQVREAPPPRVSALLERARREQELGIAHRVQSGLLPTKDPEITGFDVAGICQPASEVGGDYFDYFKLSDGRLGIAVGDVSGKGVPAAFFMTMTKGFMEVAATEAREPEAVLAQANTHLRDTLAKGIFVTMAYAILDPESSVVTFARAGHNPPVWGRAGRAAELVAPSGTALGAAPPRTFEQLLVAHPVELRRGDVLVFYTDGVTEAMNTAHQEFGEERLLAAVARHRDGLSARALVGKVLEEVTDFSRGASQHDDITLVVIKAS